jgi:hypothetical protein
MVEGTVPSRCNYVSRAYCHIVAFHSIRKSRVRVTIPLYVPATHCRMHFLSSPEWQDSKFGGRKRVTMSGAIEIPLGNGANFVCVGDVRCYIRDLEGGKGR